MSSIGIVLWLFLVIAFVGLSGDVQAQSDDGLVAKWHFDEGEGSVLKDSSGNGNAGTIYGATWVEGKYGKALSFDGKGDYVDCGNDASLDDIAVKTLVFRVNLNAQTGSGVGSHFLNKGSSNGWFISTDPSKNRNIFGQGFSRTNGRWSFPQFSLNKWHHIVAVYDRQSVTNDPVIYVDGVSQTVTEYSTPSGTTSSDVGNNLLISADFSFDRWVDGSIDEMYIYNRALTADEIKELYKGKQTALTITKSASPHSIRQFQKTVITLSTENTGITDVTDIEITDAIHPSFDLISGNFPNPKRYDLIRPGETRDLQYIISAKESGTFMLDLATVTYADEDGNIQEASSEPASIKVIPSTGGNTSGDTLHSNPLQSDGASTPGFAVVVAITGLLTIYMRKRV